jgi:hypothetical protein
MTRRDLLAASSWLFMESVVRASSDTVCDVLVTGGSLGGVAAAPAAAQLGSRVVLVEETEWIGGQATTQGVPLDEHPYIESYGRTKSYAQFRTGVRDYYRRHYKLSSAAMADPHFNPGAGCESSRDIGYPKRTWRETAARAITFEHTQPAIHFRFVRATFWTPRNQEIYSRSRVWSLSPAPSHAVRPENRRLSTGPLILCACSP